MLLINNEFFRILESSSKTTMITPSGKSTFLADGNVNFINGPVYFHEEIQEIHEIVFLKSLFLIILYQLKMVLQSL